jgi:hypothetical protein
MWENMQMISSSIFPFKINRNSRQRHVVPFKIRHVAIKYIFFNFKAFFKKIIIIIFGTLFRPHEGGRPPQFGLGVVQPSPYWPIWGWLNHPRGPWGWFGHSQGQNGKPKNVRVLPWGWLNSPNHPCTPRGWFSHLQTGRSGGGRTTTVAHEGGSATFKGKTGSKKMLGFYLGGGRTTLVAHGGGSATLKGKMGSQKMWRFCLGGVLGHGKQKNVKVLPWGWLFTLLWPSATPTIFLNYYFF